MLKSLELSVSGGRILECSGIDHNSIKTVRAVSRRTFNSKSIRVDYLLLFRGIDWCFGCQLVHESLVIEVIHELFGMKGSWLS
jgi:hypothetical protein